MHLLYSLVFLHKAWNGNIKIHYSHVESNISICWKWKKNILIPWWIPSYNWPVTPGFNVIFNLHIIDDLRRRDLTIIRDTYWYLQPYRHFAGVLCQKQVSRAGTSNYIPQYLWDVVTCPFLSYLLLAQHPWMYLTCARGAYDVILRTLTVPSNFINSFKLFIEHKDNYTHYRIK